MLDRKVVEEFLRRELEDWDIEIFGYIPKDTLVEAFCQNVEGDGYQWLKDNFGSFFEHGNPDWDWIRQKIKASEEQ